MDFIDAVLKVTSSYWTYIIALAIVTIIRVRMKAKKDKQKDSTPE